MTCFFLFKEFYSKLSKHKHHQNPMANCWSKHMEPFIQRFFQHFPGSRSRGPRGPGLLPRSSLLIHNSQSHTGVSIRKFQQTPSTSPRYLQNTNMKRFPRRVWSIFCWTLLTFIWSHEVSCSSSTEIQSEICPLNVFTPSIPSIKKSYPQNQFHVPYIWIACLFTKVKTACPHCALTINYVIPNSNVCSRWSVPIFTFHWHPGQGSIPSIVK